jgi:carbon monoxide dehydrogenase subunit G
VKITNEFTVHTPIDTAWAVLTDLEGIAPCLPGAQLTGVDGDVYSGKVKVKVGPVVSDFAGTARFVEKDDTTHRAVIDAKGRDSRSAGNAAALITARLRADGDATVVSVDTDLKISGKLAQFGSGMIKEVSGKLLGQFVESLEAKIGADSPAGAPPAVTAPASVGGPAAAVDAGPATGSTTSDATTAAVTGGSTAGTAAADIAAGTGTRLGTNPARAAEPALGGGVTTGDGVDTTATVAAPVRIGAPGPRGTAEPEPLDLMDLAGGSVGKRLAPVVIGVAAIVAVVVIVRIARR